MNSKEYYSTDEIADLLGVTRPTVRRYLVNYHLPTLRLDGGWRVPPESLERLLKALYKDKDQGNE